MIEINEQTTTKVEYPNCPDDWNISYYLKDYGKTWIAYPRKMEQEATL